MFRSYRIGTLLGFPIDVNVSFLIMLGVVLLWTGGLAGVFIVLLAFASVLLHELGHAVVARRLGVPVPGIELHFFGGAAKMGAQPRTANDEIAIAAAGPAVSFVLAGIGLGLGAVTGVAFIGMLGWINLVIGAFNLLPALPMDGGRILRALLTRKYSFARATHLSVQVARGFAVAFVVLGLATFHLFLIALAVVLWMMGTAELRSSQMFGYSGGSGRPEVLHRRGHPQHPQHPQHQQHQQHRQHQQRREPGFSTGFHRPVATGGFVIRRRGNRFVIEVV